MKPDRLPHPKSLIPLIERLGSGNIDLELFVLKCHLIAERELYSLLAIRLEMLEKHLPALQFFPLAKLALGGDPFKETLAAVLALNDLRNEYGHEFEENDLHHKMEVLANNTGTFWPSHDPLKKPLSWLKMHDSSVRVACFACINDVWIHITQLSLDKGLYPSAWMAADAREELNRASERKALNRQGQKAFQKLYDLLFTAPSDSV